MERRELTIALLAVGLVVAALVGSTIAIARRVGDAPLDRGPQLGPKGSVEATSVSFDGTVAVGFEVGDDETLVPVVLHRDDGRWSDATRIPGATQLDDITGATGAYVAVGASRHGATAWVSTDGVAWRQAVASTGPGWGEFTAVAPRRDGVVAVGTRHTDTSTIPVVAVGDGSTWRSRALPLPDGFSGAQASDVVVRGDAVVAIGSGIVGRSTTPLAWTLDDASRWRVEAIANVGDAPVTHASGRAVTATSTAFVAVGQDRAHPAMWTSPDGITWRTAQLPATPPPGWLLLDVAATGGNDLIAVGRAVSVGDRLSGIVLRSHDGGVTWARDVDPDRDDNGRGFTRVITTTSGTTLLPES